jgi:hypothetical protein
VPHQLHCNPPPLLDELDEDELEELDDELLLDDELELDELLPDDELDVFSLSAGGVPL